MPRCGSATSCCGRTRAGRRRRVPRSHLDALGAGGLYDLVDPRSVGDARDHRGARGGRLVDVVRLDAAPHAGTHPRPRATARKVAMVVARLGERSCACRRCVSRTCRGPGPPAVVATRCNDGWLFSGRLAWLTSWGARRHLSRPARSRRRRCGVGVCAACTAATASPQRRQAHDRSPSRAPPIAHLRAVARTRVRTGVWCCVQTNHVASRPRELLGDRGASPTIEVDEVRTSRPRRSHRDATAVRRRRRPARRSAAATRRHRTAASTRGSSRVRPYGRGIGASRPVGR